MTVRPVVWIGIDAGKAAHHAAAVDEQGRVCWSQKVPNDQAAIEELVARAAGTAEEVRWAVDLTGSAAALLLAVLIAAGQQVAYVPGRTGQSGSPGTGRGTAPMAFGGVSALVAQVSCTHRYSPAIASASSNSRSIGARPA
jgi:hypothetical protein